MHKKVLFLDTVHASLEEQLLAAQINCEHDYESSKVQLQSKIDQYQGIVIRSRIRLDEEILQHATQLEFIARAGAGLENIDLDYCLKRNIQVFPANEGNRDAVAEHATGMLLALLNRLCIVNQEVRKGIWLRAENRGTELMGKTIGIIGYGHTGQAFAKRLSGFGMTILAHDKYKSNFGSEQVIEVDLKTIQEQADIISLHLPLAKETQNYIDEEFIRKCKKNFYFVNTARGNLISSKTLLGAIHDGKILGACLDVYDLEKSSFSSLDALENHPEWKELINSEKVLLSPHIAGWTHESHRKLSEILADKVLRFYKKS